MLNRRTGGHALCGLCLLILAACGQTGTLVIPGSMPQTQQPGEENPAAESNEPDDEDEDS